MNDDTFGCSWLIGGAIALVATTLFIADCAGARTENHQCAVVAHGHQAAYRTVSESCGGKPVHCTPIVINHPEQWWLVVKQPSMVGSGVNNMPVDVARWAATTDGQQVVVRYRVGRFSKHYYATGLLVLR